MIQNTDLTAKKILAGKSAFTLFDTYGFPLEMTIEIAEEKGLTVDIEGFKKAFSEHQKKSQSAAAGKFKGGLADHDENTLALHTATHLLLAGLQKFLGTEVHQAGSNITPERLRFDFTHPEKVTRDILDKIEEYVNTIISQDCAMTCTNMAKEVAKEQGVEGSFWEKYPDEVKVYTLQNKN